MLSVLCFECGSPKLLTTTGSGPRRWCIFLGSLKEARAAEKAVEKDARVAEKEEKSAEGVADDKKKW